MPIPSKEAVIKRLEELQDMKNQMNKAIARSIELQFKELTGVLQNEQRRIQDEIDRWQQ